MKKINSKGFSHVEMLIVAVVLVVVGAVGFYVFNKVQDRSSRAETEDTTATLPESVSELGKSVSNSLKTKATSFAAKETNTETVAAGEDCSNGGGISGARVQILYVDKSNATGHAANINKIREVAATMDATFSESAARTGGNVNVRWARNNQCKIIVQRVKIDGPAFYRAMGNGNPANLTQARSILKQKGFDNPNRKYIVYVDGPDGITNYFEARADDKPTQNNLNNGLGFVFSSIRNADLNNPYISSERVIEESRNLMFRLASNLGAIQNSAPNSATRLLPPNTSTWMQCTDSGDVLCRRPEPEYGNGGITKAVPAVCKDPTVGENIGDDANNWLLDCNGDDYFNTKSAAQLPAGHYLKNHWNIANSKFLNKVAN